jgi:2,3-bisphosphoglycerate-dependent phosphoglycerate mutase
MTDLLLIRHGQTDFNRELRFQGHVDAPLNATGHAQAARLAARLADEDLDVVVSSDLLRARDTAAPLLARRPLPSRLDPAWREQAFGELEGLIVSEVPARHPTLWAAWSRHEADSAPPGGESYRAFHARVMTALNALAEAHAGARIAVFTHGGALDMVWRDLHGLPLAGPRQCEIPNTGVNRLRWASGRLELLQWADTAHLG